MRKRIKPLPSIEHLRSTFIYFAESGRLIRRKCGREARTLQKSGYIVTGTANQMILVHRIAWALHHGAWPDGELDHRDGNKTNNRINNLRIATRNQQMHNMRARKGLKGVCRAPSKTKPYRAQINANCKHYYLGAYATAEEAAAAYRAAAKILHGEFANTTSANNAPMTPAMVD